MNPKHRLVEIGRRQNTAAGTDAIAFRIKGSLTITQDTMNAFMDTLWTPLELERPSRTARMLVVYDARHAVICAGTLESHQTMPPIPRWVARQVQRRFLSFTDPEKALAFLGVVMRIWLANDQNPNE